MNISLHTLLLGGILAISYLPLAAQDSPPRAVIPGQNWVSSVLAASDETIYTYAEITGARTGIGSMRLSVRIDSGQVVEVTRGRGKPVDGSDFYPYASMAAALNDLTRRGYQLVSTQTIVTADSYWGMVWLARRPLRREEVAVSVEE